MRVFIAIELPEKVKSKIFHEFETLEKKNLFTGRFVPKENLHLTLKFFGDVSEDGVEEIKKKLRKIKSGPISCSTNETGFFNSEKFIRVIWIGLASEGDKLKELQKEVADTFPEISHDYEEFNSHITAARVQNIPNKANKDKLLDEIKKIKIKRMDFEVNEIVLMKSEFISGGDGNKRSVKYKVLDRFSLG